MFTEEGGSVKSVRCIYGIAIVALVSSMASTGTAIAEPAASPDGAGGADAQKDVDSNFNTVLKEEEKANEAALGIGLRARAFTIPKPLLELFVDEAASGITFAPGFGVDFVRRKKNFEINVGVEWHKFTPQDGYWTEKDGPTDMVYFEKLDWVTLDATFYHHLHMHRTFAFRYGGGIGLGMLFGDVTHTDAICSDVNNQRQCMIDPNAIEVDEKFEIPPVLPVLSLMAGFQFRPTDSLQFNLEGGIRNAPFFGVTASYLFR